MGQDHIWNGTESLLLVEDPAQREVVATVGGVEVAQVNSFFSLMLRWAQSRRARSERSFAPSLSYIILTILLAILNSFGVGRSLKGSTSAATYSCLLSSWSSLSTSISIYLVGD